MMELFGSLRHHRRLLVTLIRQKIASSYRQTLLGFVWILLMPLLFIVVFTFVRLVLIGGKYAQWEANIAQSVGLYDVALAIFTGLIIFWLFSESITQATGSIEKGSVYITEMNFPAELLVLSVVGVTLFHTVARLALLLIGMLTIMGGIPTTAPLLLPTVLPLLIGTLGICFLFAAVGAFIPDLAMVVNVFMTALLFMSGVIFPMSAIPAPYQDWMRLNPIAFTIEQARDVVLWGEGPSWTGLGLFLLASLLVLQVGYSTFRRVRRKFADVV
jgi:lipopolysaccharide transport system permease protein